MIQKNRPQPKFETLEPRLLLSGAPGFSETVLRGAPVDGSEHSVAGVTAGRAARAPADDYGNSMTQARLLQLSATTGGGATSGTINYVGDVDFFTFTATLSGTMRIDEARCGAKNKLSGELVVYDASGVPLATDSNSADPSATVSLNVTAGQIYYLKVGGLAGTTGKYSVTISTAQAPTPTPPPPEPTPPPPDPTPPPADYTPGADVVTQIVSGAAGLQLVVIGTNGNDVITLSQISGAMTVATSLWSRDVTGTFSSVVIYGFSGDDTLRTTNTVTCAVQVYGGDGNDSLFDAGASAATLWAGAGDDLLVTVGGGKDTVYGEAGNDSFWTDMADVLADTSAAETAAGAVHRISAFYQPAGSSVPLEIAGQNLVDPASTYIYSNFSTRPLFADTPEYNDIDQGYLGDCYFLASLASLADQDPGVIKQMIAPMGDGTYAVRFYSGTTAVYLRVDADLPTSGSAPIYAGLGRDNELWVALAEKAYAFFRYGQNSYASIEGGWMGDVNRAVTGVASPNVSTSSMSASSIATTISNYLSAGHALTAATWSTAGAPFVGNHAYMVKSIETSEGTTYVTVYNPWAWDGVSWDSNSGDGLLRMTIDQFKAGTFGLAVAMV